MTTSIGNSEQLKLIRWPQTGISIVALLLIHGWARWQIAASNNYLWSAIVSGVVLFALGAWVRRTKPKWFEAVYIPLFVLPQSIIYDAYYPDHKNLSFQSEIALTLQWLTLSLTLMILLFFVATAIKRRREQ